MGRGRSDGINLEDFQARDWLKLLGAFAVCALALLVLPSTWRVGICRLDILIGTFAFVVLSGQVVQGIRRRKHRGQ